MHNNAFMDRQMDGWMDEWMNSMLIAISPKPLSRRITKFNKRWYSYINLDANIFTFI